MKTLSQKLNESCVPFIHAINEAFSSTIMANMHKDNSEVMNQFFRSLAKYRYSVNGLKDDFITRTDIASALKNKNKDIVKFWMVGQKVAAITVGNALVDEMFNWVSKGQGSRNNEALIGNKAHIEKWLSDGDKYAKDMFTTCYMIVISSLKALGEKKEPTEIVDQEEKIVFYKPNLLDVPKNFKKKPSDLKKLKDTSKTMDVVFKSGDTYDLSDTGYVDKFKYYSGEGDGYIMDKQGNTYDVFCNEGSSDSGRIAGGTMNWRCGIKIDNQIKLNFTGYHGVFSSPSSKTAGSIVQDIRNGMYLEDYIAQHYQDLNDHNNLAPKVKAFMEAGDINAKSYNGIKNEISKTKETNFFLTYILLPKVITFTISSSGIELINILAYDKELANRSKELSKFQYGSDEFNALKDARSKILATKTEIVVNGILKPLITKELKKIFQVGSISSYAGIESTLFCKELTAYNHTLALDTKTNNIVIVNTDDLKVVGNAKLVVEDNVILFKKQAAPKALDLFKKTSEAWLKMNKNKQSQYVDEHWAKVYENSYKPYRGYELTKSAAKASTKQEYQKMLDNHSFDKSNRLVFSWDFLKNYIDGEMDKNAIEPLPEPTAFKTMLPKAVMAEAGGKMDAWHNGSRNQNVKSMSDAKLKMNYEVCKDKGYDKEVGILQMEAKRRSILLECYGINECLTIV